jgi:hypothetical protein
LHDVPPSSLCEGLLKTIKNGGKRRKRRRRGERKEREGVYLGLRGLRIGIERGMKDEEGCRGRKEGRKGGGR